MKDKALVLVDHSKTYQQQFDMGHWPMCENCRNMGKEDGWCRFGLPTDGTIYNPHCLCHE